MKIKLFTLLILIFSSQSVSAVVVIEGKGAIKNNQTVDKKEKFNAKTLNHKRTKKKLKKNKRFKFFQWFKLKKAFKNKKKSHKKLDVFSLIAGIAGTLAIASIFLGIGWFLLMSKIGGVFGYLGLRNIKKDPENLKGKALAWLGMLTGVILIIGLLAFLIIAISDPEGFGG